MLGKRMLFGSEVTARGTYETGVKVFAAYSDTPSTEVSESLVQYDKIYAEWAPNEKVATEMAIGVSIAGVRSMCVIKHVGINVAVNPLYTVVRTDVQEGLVLVVANDPGMYSPQNKQDSRMVARAAMVPIVEPSDSAGTREFMKYAYDLNEKYDTSIVLRSTTRLSHSQGLVELEERVEPFNIPYERNMAKYVVMPGNAIGHHVVVRVCMKQIAEGVNSFPINRTEYNDSPVGFIISGIAYQYTKGVMPQVSVLKLGFLNPFPKKLVEEFASKVGELYVFEELEPVVGEQVKSWGIKKAVDKEIFTVQGEYSVNLIRGRVLGQAPQADKAAQVPVRPPILCPGCPHRSVYTVLNRLKIHVTGDIGCHTLGTVAPLSVIDTMICMGASISTLHSTERVKGGEYIKNWVAVIGDSTFIRTDISSLMNMVHGQAAGIVVILDNSTTGTTGHQGHATTGKIPRGQVAPTINICDLCKSLGTEHVCKVDDFNQAELERIIEGEVARDAVSVITTKVPRALFREIKFPNKCRPLPDERKKCGAYLRSDCPTLTKNEDGAIPIDGTMCNGCGLCKQLCKFDAINLARVGE